MLYNMNFDEIQKSTIDGVVEVAAPEDIYLEFKECTYRTHEGKSEHEQKREYLKDISAFANSLGGHLILGVKELNGCANKICPIECNVDEEIQWLTELSRYGIDPPLVGLRIKQIECNGGYIFIIHVPRSYNPPHRVIHKGSNKFYVRKSNNSIQPSIEELRLLFGQQRTLEEQAETFISQRFLRIQANNVPFKFREQEKLILHIVPLLDFGSKRQHDLSHLSQYLSEIRLLGNTGHLYRVNLDGYLIESTNDYVHSWTQLFRNGVIESVWAGIVSADKIIAPIDLIRYLYNSINSQFKFLKLINASPPILMQISFVGMSGTSINLNGYFKSGVFENEELLLPYKIVTAFLNNHNYREILLDQMDFLWNAFGQEKCNFLIDDTGAVKLIGN